MAATAPQKRLETILKQLSSADEQKQSVEKQDCGRYQYEDLTRV